MPRLAATLTCILLLAAACDNVGRAFDPGSKGGGGGGNTGQNDKTNIQSMVIGGDAVEGRPVVKSVYPKGTGHPGTVPIVVVFSESMNQDSVAPAAASGAQPNLYVRAKGTTQILPAQYDFLMGNTTVVIRPLAALPSAGSTPGAGAIYEVVILPDVRDGDAVRYGGPAESVLAEFTVSEDAKVTNGQILTTLPEGNKRDIQRESIVYAIFNKPAAPASITSSNFVLRQRGAQSLPGSASFPLSVASTSDGRVLRFTPKDVMPGDSDIEIEVNDTILFGSAGKLDFKNKTPFASFRTLPFAQAESVKVGNFAVGFPDKVNRGNIDNLQLDVRLGASAEVDDTLNVRVYGLDPETKNTSDVNFVTRSARVPATGVQTVTVDFAGALGSSTATRFSEGTLVIAVQIARGSRRAGFVLSSSTNQPRLDVTPPGLTSVGPPAGTNPNEILTDQESFALSGRASEKLSEASLTAGAESASLYASNGDGRFVTRPIFLGRMTNPLAYQLTLRDSAGNLATGTVTGTITSRGSVTGSVAGGTLVVEAYDDTNLQALANVTVLVEPGLPVKPAVGRLSATTDASGRATFAGLANPSYTITLLRTGYHLKSFVGTPAGFVSLALRPIANATAFLAGSAVFVPTPGTTALVGTNLFDDPAQEAIATQSATPTVITRTAMRPLRMQALNAFAGAFEPAQVATYTFFACQLCGADGVTITAPPSPPGAGESLNQQLALLTAAGTTLNLASAYAVDFATAGGLDTGTITKPKVRVMSSLRGFPGMSLLGVGFSTAGAGASYTMNATYSLLATLNLAAFQPVLWISSEAKDAAGNVSRHRRLVLDNSLGTTYATGNPIGIPTITTPGGPFTGSPQLTHEDRVDPAQIIGGWAFHEIVATDAAGRMWSVVRPDTDPASGPFTLQLPDLAGLDRLAAGNWSIYADTTLSFSAYAAPADYVLEEMRRQQVMFARAAAKAFSISD